MSLDMAHAVHTRTVETTSSLSTDTSTAEEECATRKSISLIPRMESLSVQKFKMNAQAVRTGVSTCPLSCLAPLRIQDSQRAGSQLYGPSMALTGVLPIPIHFPPVRILETQAPRRPFGAWHPLKNSNTQDEAIVIFAGPGKSLAMYGRVTSLALLSYSFNVSRLSQDRALLIR